MRFPWCITKAIATHSGYVILIALRRPLRLRERASVLRYRYIPFLVNVYHSKDVLFWLLIKVTTSDRPFFVLLVCSPLIPTSHFQMSLCVYSVNIKHGVAIPSQIYASFAVCFCRTSNMFLVTYSLQVWGIYMAIVNDHWN
jgi:hypothetical protein